MHIRDLDRRRICILGFGKEGQSTLHALEKHAPNVAITIADSNPQIRDTRYEMHVGPSYLDSLDRFDVIIKSPGIPPSSAFDNVRGKITSATQIFLDTIADTGAITIGITGSKGKSTTTTLLYGMLKAAGKDALLVGNIGVPALDFLDRVHAGSFVVQEMSSYQLMDLTRSPRIAVITAFFPEHLDYHGSLAAYKEAKAHITRFQREEDAVFYNVLFPEAKEIAEESPGEKIPYAPEDAPVMLAETRLIGAHNLGNMAGAFLVASHVGAPRAICINVLKSFPGLPHRLQRLGVHDGIEWVDDAISTTPESTIAALKALGDRVQTIILGGQDRGNDFTQLGREIARSKIRTVILFPGSGQRIRAAIEAASASVALHAASSMEEAVSIAKAVTNQLPATSYQQPPLVLLSTASPSYGMFKNFEEKGDLFQKCIFG